MSDETPRELTEQELETLTRSALAATPGPWAWESIAEKSNEWAVGQAFREDERGESVAVSGRIDEVDERIIERRLIGMNESGHALAADAKYIAAVSPDVLLSLLHMARRGARAAMAERLTDLVLSRARQAYYRQRDDAEMRHVLLDALTGAGEETT